MSNTMDATVRTHTGSVNWFSSRQIGPRLVDRAGPAEPDVQSRLPGACCPRESWPGRGPGPRASLPQRLAKFPSGRLVRLRRLFYGETAARRRAQDKECDQGTRARAAVR